MNSNSLYQILLNKAVQLLAQRNHSSAELTQKLSYFYLRSLSNHENDDLELIYPQIDLVIQHCLSHHWLDDNHYIEQYIDMRARKGYGQARISMELKQRGLANSQILMVLKQKEIDWITIGIKQVTKKFVMIDKKSMVQKAKIFQFLLYRGFNQDEIKLIYSSL